MDKNGRVFFWGFQNFKNVPIEMDFTRISCRSHARAIARTDASTISRTVPQNQYRT